ncbi:MAG TPA: hypothetical protein VNU45_06430 [Rummeliibacillus sp.]|nr:hypothetical protein [Rummeliibacillus sp.]
MKMLIFIILLMLLIGVGGSIVKKKILATDKRSAVQVYFLRASIGGIPIIIISMFCIG